MQSGDKSADERSPTEINSDEPVPQFNQPIKGGNYSAYAAFSGFFLTAVAVVFGIEAFADKTNVKFVFAQRVVPVVIGVITKQLWKKMDRMFRLCS